MLSPRRTPDRMASSPGSPVVGAKTGTLSVCIGGHRIGRCWRDHAAPRADARVSPGRLGPVKAKAPTGGDASWRERSLPLRAGCGVKAPLRGAPPPPPQPLRGRSLTSTQCAAPLAAVAWGAASGAHTVRSAAHCQDAAAPQTTPDVQGTPDAQRPLPHHARLCPSAKQHRGSGEPAAPPAPCDAGRVRSVRRPTTGQCAPRYRRDKRRRRP